MFQLPQTIYTPDVTFPIGQLVCKNGYRVGLINFGLNTAEGCYLYKYRYCKDPIKLAEVMVNYEKIKDRKNYSCLLYTSPSPRDRQKSRMPSSA